MERDVLKKFLDACHKAKRIIELMPALPKGMSPRHIQVIDTIYQLSQRNGEVKVSDISNDLNVTRPSITKLVGELEASGVVKKVPNVNDRRVIWLRLTALGERYYDFYVAQYQHWLLQQLQEIPEDGFVKTAQTIGQVHEILEQKKPMLQDMGREDNDNLRDME